MTALELACYYQNRCCDLEEIIEQFCMDADAALQSAQPVALPLTESQHFSNFIEWANKQGYDCACTCNSDNGEWLALNPMTADLWKAWKAAHGIGGGR